MHTLSPHLPGPAKLSAALLGVLLAAGCAPYLPAAPADAGVDVPAGWSQPGSGGSQPLALWWRGFGDPLLVELVDAAQRANTDLGIAQANLREARALRDAAAAGLWPTLSVSASARRSSGGGASAGSLFDAGFDAAWEPDIFGASRHGVGVAEATAQARALTLAGTEVSVAAEVATSYLQLRGSQARAAFARENLAAQEQTLQIAQWREQAGLGSSLETSQARSAVEQTRAQLPVLRASIAQTSHALAVLTGRPPAALDAQLATAAALPRAPADLALAIPAATLRQRPDVLAAEWQLRAAAERVSQADALRRPAVQLRASLAWSAATLGSIGSIDAARSLVASIGQTLFDRGRLDAQLAAQEAAFDAARQSYRARVLTALQEVEDALWALAASRDRVGALESALLSTRDAVLLANNRYTSGLIDFQTVLETQRTLLNVQDSLASAQTELATNHVRLYKAHGGGWGPAATNPGNPS
ncbi:MAG: efflux transporter outer membrane subunit [Ramlibacter sp.]|nr:efflux transporter outer membrane subunit [Ramlibacter sp.]